MKQSYRWKGSAIQRDVSYLSASNFQHREITQVMPGDHMVRSLVGTNTIFKQLARPVHHVAYIGLRK